MASTALVACLDGDSCTNWEALLMRLGYEVIFARSGEAALTHCSTMQPDLVLLDQALPDMRPEDLYRRLRVNPRNRCMPVVHVKSPGLPSRRASDIRSKMHDLSDPTSKLPEAFDRAEVLNQLKAYVDEETHAVILGLARTIDARNHYDAEHGMRVSNHAVRLGSSLGLSEIELDALRIGGLVHDIGKIAVSDAILSKPGCLSTEEISIMKKHPVVGEQICAPLKSLRHVLPVIRHHHERMDGSGYPDGLRGDEIPITAQVLHLADICDALTSDRPYRRAMSLPSALLCLYQDAERGWVDERLVQQMAGLILGGENVTRSRRGTGFSAASSRGSAGPS